MAGLQLYNALFNAGKECYSNLKKKKRWIIVDNMKNQLKLCRKQMSIPN